MGTHKTRGGNKNQGPDCPWFFTAQTRRNNLLCGTIRAGEKCDGQSCYPILQQKNSIKRTAPKVSKGRRIASGDKQKAEQVSRNERPWAATIEAADTPAGAKSLPLESNRPKQAQDYFLASRFSRQWKYRFGISNTNTIPSTMATAAFTATKPLLTAWAIWPVTR